jgi:CheY-like chemotaxis protein
MSGRVLVVDDDADIRQLIKVNLELEGFEVVTAVDGVECLDVVHGVRPDLVTLDVAMPRLDGLRTAERLRSDPRTRHIPVALVSGHPRIAGADGEEPPVDALLPKPFEPSELVRLVRRLTHGAAADEAGAKEQGGQVPVARPARR